MGPVNLLLTSVDVSMPGHGIIGFGLSALAIGLGLAILIFVGLFLGTVAAEICDEISKIRRAFRGNSTQAAQEFPCAVRSQERDRE